MTEPRRAEQQRPKVYDQLCISYRAIDDFRAKLLGFLPLVSGSGAFLLLNESVVGPNRGALVQQYLASIATFGFVVTLGLFTYELYGIRKCHALIEAGARLERVLHVHAGQFTRRPRSVLFVINEPFAAAIIYPAVLAAWAFLACVPPPPFRWFAKTIAPRLAASSIFVTGFVITVLYSLLLASARKLHILIRRRRRRSRGAKV